MTLQRFRTELFTQAGLARSNKWSIAISPPRGITALGQALDSIFNSNNDTEGNQIAPTFDGAIERSNDLLTHINLYASSVELPGRDIVTLEGQQYGQARAMGFNHQHADTNIEFYSSEDLRERLFFEQWQESIFNWRNGNVGYYDEYASSIIIQKLDYTGKTIEAQYKLQGCYPTNVGTQAMSHDNGEPLRLNVTFKTHYYERIS